MLAPLSWRDRYTTKQMYALNHAITLHKSQDSQFKNHIDSWIPTAGLNPDLCSSEEGRGSSGAAGG